MKKLTLIVLTATFALGNGIPTASAGIFGKLTREILEESLDQAAKRSGRESLKQESREASLRTLEKMALKYGDDAVLATKDAGLELLEAVPQYGDEVIELAMAASPQARRVFAMNIDELLPLARRVGVEALEMEAKAPGLGLRVFRAFGDDAGRAIAQSVPADDIPRLLKYAELSDGQVTKELLMSRYAKEGKSLFERIPPKFVLASGLTASMLYGTHKMAGPADAIADKIKESPDVAGTAVSHFFAWASLVIILTVTLLLWRFGLMPWHRETQFQPQRDNGRTESPSQVSQLQEKTAVGYDVS